MKLWVTSGYGTKFGPFVTISKHTGDQEEPVCQMSLDEARHHAASVLAACEAAESDGVFVELGREVLKLDERKVAAFLLQCRQWRADSLKKARAARGEAIPS